MNLDRDQAQWEEEIDRCEREFRCGRCRRTLPKSQDFEDSGACLTCTECWECGAHALEVEEMDVPDATVPLQLCQRCRGVATEHIAFVAQSEEEARCSNQLNSRGYTEGSS